jgi:hypothetical protein
MAMRATGGGYGTLRKVERERRRAERRQLKEQRRIERQLIRQVETNDDPQFLWERQNEQQRKR